jgi:uncharacterized protein (DUF1800 family)
MRQLYLVAVFVLAATAACSSHRSPLTGAHVAQVDQATIVHLLNRTTFGVREPDVERVQSIGVASYIDEQLHPERIDDPDVETRLAALAGLRESSRAFAADFYVPMTKARSEYTAAQNQKTTGLPYLRWHLLPIAAMTLPGDKPVVVLQQGSVTQEELRYQRENQTVFEDLQSQKLLRAVYSRRQLQEVLTDFWFNHFNIDARKIEDKPVMVEYERDVIRPRVFGKFRDLLEADAKSPAMLFYLDNWVSRAKAINENYAREVMELHTLGVDGGYTQGDVMEVARAFTGWTMSKPHEASGFEFNAKAHDGGAKLVLGRRLKAGSGMQDGESVLDILAKHPSTARFIATKLARRFVSDDPPPSLVARVAKTFTKSDGDLREVMRVLLTSPEFYAASSYDAKVKSPLEFVAGALRVTGASVTNPRGFTGTIANLGEPLYQCQPPSGYPDRSSAWMNTGALVGRLNFARSLAGNGLPAARVDPPTAEKLVQAVLATRLSAESRSVVAAGKQPATRLALLLGSPEYQQR